MAIEKKTIYNIQCEGPCGQTVPRAVDKIPPSWSRLKIMDAVQVLGHPLEYIVTTLCFSCTSKAIQVLKDSGFKLTTIKPSVNVRKKDAGE